MPIPQYVPETREAYFSYFESGADHAYRCAGLIKDLCERPYDNALREQVLHHGHEAAAQMERLVAMTRASVAPALERPDIEEVAESIRMAAETTAHFAELLGIAPAGTPTAWLQSEAAALEWMAGTVCQMVGQLRNIPYFEGIDKANRCLDDAEDERERAELLVNSELIHRKCGEASQLLALGDLSDCLEQACDKHRELGRLLVHLVLKYS